MPSEVPRGGPRRDETAGIAGRPEPRSRPGGGRRRGLRWPTRRCGTDRRIGRRRGSLDATSAIHPATSAETWVIMAAVRAEFVEEHRHVGVGAPRGGPHQSPAVVVDHDDQILVPALVGDLIDPDPPQPVEPIDCVAPTSVTTRATIEPTVRHATRKQLTRRDFDVRTASTPPCRRSRVCDRHRDEPTAPPPPSGHERGNGPAERRLRTNTFVVPHPTPATADDHHHGRSEANVDGSVRTGHGPSRSVVPTPRSSRRSHRRVPLPRPSRQPHARSHTLVFSTPSAFLFISSLQQRTPRNQTGCTRG